MSPHRDPPATIAQLEFELQGALEALRDLERQGKLPPALTPLVYLAPQDGASVHISLRARETGRQLRRNQPLESFQPRSSAVWVVYEVPQQESLQTDPGTGEPMVDFVLALDHAERDPHLSFIALKWFRDTYLQKRGFAWAFDPDMPRRLIQEATDAGLIAMHKVPNPKQPEFPVTGIRLDRAHPLVQDILQTAALSAAESGSQPPEKRDTVQ
jgi:hypothetical protein